MNLNHFIKVSVLDVDTSFIYLRKKNSRGFTVIVFNIIELMRILKSWPVIVFFVGVEGKLRYMREFFGETKKRTTHLAVVETPRENLLLLLV